MGMIPDGTPVTVKEIVILKFEEKLKAMVRSDDNTSLFKTVVRGDADDYEMKPNLGPYAFYQESDDNIEGVQQGMTGLVVNRTLSVIVQVRYASNAREVDPYKLFNYYIGLLQVALLSDPKFDDTALDIDELQNAPEVLIDDNFQGGFIVFRVRYRHVKNNPYQRR